MNFKCLLAFALFASFVSPHQGASAQTVATVGSKKITLEEFKKKYDELKRTPIPLPSYELFLEDLIRYEVGVQEAEKRKIQEDADVKERFRQEMYKGLIEKDLGQKVKEIKVTETEMKKYYEKNPDLKAAHILIEFKQNASEEEIETSKKRALEILKEVKSSKRDFAELVKLYSDDVISKDRMGDLEFQNRLTLVPAFYDAALALKPGQISDLVRTRFGFHIIKLLERRSYGDITDKRPLRAAVWDEKRKDIFDAYFKKLKGNYNITVSSEALKGLK